MTKTTLELQLLSAIQGRIFADGVDAIALRWPLTRYGHQPIDLIVDSSDRKYFLGVECKSLKRANKESLRLNSQFTQKRKGDQFRKESQYLRRSGRRGFCAVEIWGSPQNSCHIIPWEVLEERFASESPVLSMSEVSEFPGPRRSAGGYIIESWNKLFGEF